MFKTKILLLSISLFLTLLGVGPVQAAGRGVCETIFTVAAHSTSTSGARIEAILIESIEGSGNFTSRHSVSHSEALELGQQWLGGSYKQIGKIDSGVFVSSDGKRRFRIDNGSLIGNHSPGVPHIHLELINPLTGFVLSNNHIGLLP